VVHNVEFRAETAASLVGLLWTEALDYLRLDSTSKVMERVTKTPTHDLLEKCPSPVRTRFAASFPAGILA